MPIEVLTDRLGASETSGAPFASDTLLLHLRLRAHQSLSPEGFVTFIGLTFVMMLVPLTVLIGTGLWWGVAPFVLGSLGLCWLLLKRSWRDRSLQEDLRLWPARLEIHRQNPRGPDQHFEANPYWLRPVLHSGPKSGPSSGPRSGPVPDYLTIEGGPRVVELGAFLTPQERRSLHQLLRQAQARVGATP